MSLIKLITLTLALLFSQGTQEVESKEFNIDAVHSTAIFRVHHVGAGMFYGRFNDVTGMIALSGDTPSFDVSIAIDSVDSSNERLDSHLKSPDFFNAVEFPAMSFKSSSVKSVGDNNYEVTGEITMHGVAKPITVNMEKTGHADGRRGEMIGFETEFELTRSDFGMNYGVESGSLGDKVKVIVALEAKRSGSD